MFFNFFDQVVKKQQIVHNRYQIICILGQGGMGITYKAKDLKINSLVAIKVISLRGSNEMIRYIW